MATNLRQIVSMRKPCVFHVNVQKMTENISGDQTEIMSIRQTGFCLLNSHTVQETHDLALVAHLASMAAKKPVAHFFDGQRTSHEVTEVHLLSSLEIRRLANSISTNAVENVEVGFQQIPDLVDQLMEELAPSLGKRYGLFEYSGDADAESVIIIMDAGAAVVEESLAQLRSTGAKVGVLKVHLYRPWSPKHFLAALPPTVKRVAVLERAVEATSQQGPLTSDVAMSFHSEHFAGEVPTVTSGVFGIGSEELYPAMVKAVFHNLWSYHPAQMFALDRESAAAAGVELLPVGRKLNTVPEGTVQCLVFGHSADGTIEAAKRSLHLLSEHLDVFVQGHFVQDSISADEESSVVNAHLRFGPDRVQAPYLIDSADYVLVNDVKLLNKYHVLGRLRRGGTLVLNCDWTQEQVVAELPPHLRKQIAKLSAKLFLVNAKQVAETTGASVAAAMQAVFCQVHALQAATREAGAAQCSSAVVGFRAGAMVHADSSEMVRQLLGGSSSAGVKAEVVSYPREQWLQDVSVGWAPTVVTNDAGLMAVPSAVLAPKSVSSSSHSRVLSHGRAKVERKEKNFSLHSNEAMRFMLFSKAFQGKQQLRMGTGTHQVRCADYKRLTPVDYDRNIFHIEFDLTGSDLTYSMGDALAVHPYNGDEDVDAFMSMYGLDKNTTWAVDKEDDEGEGKVEVLTLGHLFTQVLDIFGRPSKKFYKALAELATDAQQKAALEELAAGSTEEAKAKFAARVLETVTFADLLAEFPSARPGVAELIQLVPRIKARLYSIASSSLANPGKVELLVVLEDWKTPSGKYKMGLCSDYLRSLVGGLGTPRSLITASVSSSLMKLPADPLAPIVMAGTGTGMAPFRAFLQERHHLATRQGKRTGDSVLYFGARYSSQEYLYKEELQAFERDGTLTHFRPAWSRDQKHKIYIQHRIAEDAEVLWTLLVLKRGSFYLCGQAGRMPGDVYDAIASGFVKAGKVTLDEARKMLSDMKEEGRYVVEVY